EKRVFLVILFTSFSGSLVSRIPGAVHKARLNAACARALKTKVWRLSGIKSILEKGLDKQPVQDPKPDLLSTMEHENVRGSEYYH
ncbi:hypothetical protein ACPXCK_23350, partial [Escherichia coli]